MLIMSGGCFAVPGAGAPDRPLLGLWRRHQRTRLIRPGLAGKPRRPAYPIKAPIRIRAGFWVRFVVGPLKFTAGRHELLAASVMTHNPLKRPEMASNPGK